MGKRILIIDDDRIILESLQEHIGDAGYSVLVAVDGISGFDLIAREKPDLVVADILLPRMHGIALCEKIRASDEFGHVPIILMTGVYKDVNLRMYVHKGLADDFIEKPFKEQELIAKIEHLLGSGTRKAESLPEPRSAPLPEHSERSERSGTDRKGPADRSLESELDELIHWAHGKKK